MAQTLFTDLVTLILSAWLNDVDASTYNALSSVSGTNTILATGPTTVTSYAADQKFFFRPAVTNTGATTINISSIGAKNIFSNNAACIGNELVAGVPVLIYYDGTQFHIVGNGSKRAGAYGSMQVFTGNGTWTKPSGLVRVKVTVVGGGGAGGGPATTGASQQSGGGGGGAGGASIKTIATAALGATETVTVGAGGTGVAGGTGNTGGTSSFGAHCSATGGVGAVQNGPATSWAAGGGSGGVGSSGDLNFDGSDGGAGGGTFGQQSQGGDGGASIFGAEGGGAGGAGAFGTAGGNYGGGGGGTTLNNSAGLQAGGAGGAGVVIVEEFF